ncbi:hypothetical protein Y032_0027g1632 [Ancylostoma ceylanicum]|uniref:Uncharacterized protein n=1 Tax=Ancylostoma ceylanicum TaxID=53326 RepID=A0A016UUL0_9BILA|nr:hypothetical protein Y032_0027g1632 [Ancylostoma ceylanicum]
MTNSNRTSIINQPLPHRHSREPPNHKCETRHIVSLRVVARSPPPLDATTKLDVGTSLIGHVVHEKTPTYCGGQVSK